MQMPSEPTRAHIYRISLAVLSLLVVYGILGPDETPVWAELVAAILGVGSASLAAANTSTKPR